MRTVLGAILLLVICVVGLAVIFPVYYRRGGSREAFCLSNLHALSNAARMYSLDHKGRLPNASTWMDDLRPYLTGKYAYRSPSSENPDVFHCPDDKKHQYSYAMNSNLRLADVPEPAKAVLFFDSDSGLRNAHVPISTISDLSRYRSHHEGGWHIVAHPDGDVEVLAPAQRPESPHAP